ncbi:MAG TPA: CoA transferase, partial [Anaerolineales bacterium]
MSDKALADIRVVDFSRVLAGPYCTMLLADLGADVIKIENPVGGDETRQWGPPWLDGESARAFLKSCQTTLASTDSVTFTAILSKNAKKKKEIVGLVV